MAFTLDYILDSVGSSRGRLNTTDTTDDTRLTLVGLGRPGAEVFVFNGEAELGYAIVGADGFWVLHTGWLDNGSTYDFSARSEGATAEQSFQITIDAPWALAPETPSYQASASVGNVQNAGAFAAIKKDGSVVAWGHPDTGGSTEGVAGLDSDVVQIFTNHAAFAALKADGSVVAWGNPEAGGSMEGVQDLLQSGVKHVFSNSYAFAALKDDGSVVAWGHPAYGGSTEGVAGLGSGVVQVFSSDTAFAALKDDGSVVAWGDPEKGGSTGDVDGLLQGNVRQVFSNQFGFAALKEDGSVVVWADGNDASLAAGPDDNVVQVFSGAYIFSFLKADGSVQSVYPDLSFEDRWNWDGNAVQVFLGSTDPVYLKPDGSLVPDVQGLDGVVQVLFTVDSSFAALNADGSVTTGKNLNGDISITYLPDLTSGVKQVFSNGYAFAALKENGSVVAWGNPEYGGVISSEIQDLLDGGVVQVFNNQGAFAALKDDGSVVAWGGSWVGGEVSPEIQALLGNDVVSLADAFGDFRLSLNEAPTIDGVPAVSQYVNVGEASALADITVADADEDDVLTVTIKVLDPEGLGYAQGTLGGVPDADLQADGLQITGTASEINTALQSLSLQAQGAGQGWLEVSVHDGKATTTSHYAFTAVAPAGNTAPSFAPPGGSGTFKVDFGDGRHDQARSVVLQPDGKIVVAGSSGFFGITDSYDFALMRLNADGTLDTEFGTGGKHLIDFGENGKDDEGRSVVLQPDGKLVVAGHARVDGDTHFGVLRLNPDGTLDTDFGTNGAQWVGFSSSQKATGHSAVLQPDGKILVAGSVLNAWSDEVDFGVIRLHSDGTLDTSFGDSGRVEVFFDAGGWEDDIPYSMIVQSDGKILVVGVSDTHSGQDFSLVRLNPDGSRDEDFGEDGKLLVDVSGFHDAAYSVVVRPDGKIIVAGTSWEHGEGDHTFTLLRLNADGSRDTGFGDNGQHLLQVSGIGDSAYSVTLQPDGKILAAGSGWGGFALVRLTADGELDAEFGDGGRKLVDAGWVEQIGYSVVVQPDGKIVLAGNSWNWIDSTDFSIIRLNPDGSLDSSFNPPATAAASTLEGSTASFTEDGDAVLLDDDVAIFDAELAAQGHYAGSSITLQREGMPHPDDTFAASGALSLNGGKVSVNGTEIGNSGQEAGLLTLTFNAHATQELVNQALQLLTYSNGSDSPPASVTIVWTFHDGDASNPQSTSGTTTVGITNVNDEPTGAVLISGQAQQGETLQASNNLQDLDGLDPSQIIYQWLRDGKAIDKATGASYTLTQADVNKSISVQASYVDEQGTAESVTSEATQAVENVNDLPTGKPAISGQATQYQTLSVSSGDLQDLDGLDPSQLVYQWLRDGKAIDKATGATYTLTQADVGKAISVQASYTDGFGAKESVTSNPTAKVANVNDLPEGGVTIGGQAKQGETLQAHNNLQDLDGLDPSKIIYQWLRDGQPIDKATGASYTLTQADVNKTIRLKASYTDGQGTVESVFSQATASVLNVNDLPEGNVTITGDTRQGETLTARNDLSDLDGMRLARIGYQWLRDGEIIEGATGSSYTLARADVGKAISVQASYTDDLGTRESKTSAATEAVIATPGLETSNAEFVADLYQNLLVREPDAAGLQYWLEQLDDGRITRAELADAFSEAPEAQQYAKPVIGLYLSILGRVPDADGFQHWAQALRDGGSVEQLSLSFLESQEYEERFGSIADDGQFVDVLYEKILGREGDGPGVAFWSEQLASGADRIEVVSAFLASAEFDAQATLNTQLLLGFLGENDRFPSEEEFLQLQDGEGAQPQSAAEEQQLERPLSDWLFQALWAEGDGEQEPGAQAGDDHGASFDGAVVELSGLGQVEDWAVA
ncbi:delta-60 repeat domain-containing protein [Lampropedia hyalina DSM 16112]|jgi:uncharacterized delta-60 repeat protein|uniref:Delta-60 repeat domain-containing protein n=1 Tax=Lampropedia hyalina DSM 16112 TaxID=1122156 RepID=A0A1M4TWP1_9BURK|nr:DUF4214 domain-containing protein [Lampropedia hyalina]SHE48717.1 delta-60 repeat domain-containing protein [Lampropedia hyalina DSM 16112]